MSNKPRNIVRGQRVKSDVVARARELRSNMTPTEKIMWDALRHNRLGGFHFRRQQIIDGYIADFYCHAAAFVVELDGSIHDHQQDRDRTRDAVIRERGILISRIANDEILENLENVLTAIFQICLARIYF